MPENQSPAAQPEPEAAPGEFDFAKPSARIKRRSLKTKPGAAAKPSNGTQPASPEPEPTPASPTPAQAAAPQPKEPVEVKPTPAVKVTTTPTAPPRTLPATATTLSQAASASAAASTSQSKPAATSNAAPATSPHGTRPATLYYSSYPRKEGTTPSMKTVPTASPASSTSSTTVLPGSTTRTSSTAASSARPSSGVDYRANVERQSREQKSVGNLLSYVVYGLIAFFVISAGLAIYGADVIFKQLHDQSVTVTDLDARYAAANKDLTAKLTSTQDTLSQAQTQIARQQELILKQQEDLNRLIAATNDNANALKQEKQARTQETAALRARVRDLEERGTSSQKF